MGAIAEKCVIKVIRSVKLIVQVWHAFHIEGKECVKAQNVEIITMRWVKAASVSKSYHKVCVTGIQ